ncbi:MAG TPA: hypothetical protein VK675_03415, partial [Candidatus Paceibacterota bacterium]|nr:hypothetical protein [Candidatus Paceibacterota bacterium]
SEFVEPKHSTGKKIFFIILILVLLGGASFGAYAYYAGIFVKLPVLLSESIEKTKTIATSNYDTTFNVDYSEMKNTNGLFDSLSSIGISSKQLILTMNGSTDITESQNPKFSSLVSLNVGGAVSMEVELRFINKIFYAKLTKNPTFGTLPVSVPNISPYVNKWYSFPFADKVLANTFTGSPSATLDSIFTAEQKDHLYQMFRDAHLIKTVARLNPETAGGVSSYHFSFDPDRAGIILFFKSLDEYINTIDKNNPSLSIDESASINEGLDKIKDFKGEIWIGRNDKLIHKILLSFGVQPDSNDSSQQVKINAVSIISAYNRPVSIVAPAGSTPFASLMEASLGNAQQGVGETSIKAHLASAQTQAVLFYERNNSSYIGYCALLEAKNLRKDIEDSGGTGFVCKETSRKYAIGVKLPEDAGNWCIDSAGLSKSTKTLPSSTACPTN